MDYGLIHKYRNRPQPKGIDKDRNVLCGDGSAHAKKTEVNSHVTCPQCKRLMETKES